MHWDWASFTAGAAAGVLGTAAGVGFALWLFIKSVGDDF
jgi:hypothetical protein